MIINCNWESKGVKVGSILISESNGGVYLVTKNNSKNYQLVDLNGSYILSKEYACLSDIKSDYNKCIVIDPENVELTARRG